MPIPPYALNLSPSPTGACHALAIVGPEVRPEIGIVVRWLTPRRDHEIVRLGVLSPVAMVWDDDGRKLAIASGSFHAVWDGSSTLTSRSLPPSHCLEFGADGTLWGLGDEGLWSAPAAQPLTRISTIEDVVTFCARPLLATIRRRSSGLYVCCERREDTLNIGWPLSVCGRPRIFASPGGTALFVSADDRSGPGRLRLQFARIDIASGKAVRFFDGVLGTGIGWSPPDWAPWTESSVLFAAELDDHTSVFHIDAQTGAAERVGPSSFEVTAMSAAPRAKRVAVIGSTTGHTNSRESSLLVLDQLAQGAWQQSFQCAGVNAMPRWDDGARKLFFVHSPGFPDWRVAVEDCGAFRPTGLSARTADRDSTAADLDLSGAGPHDAALIYVAGPHRRLVDGAQSTFFHHAILSLIKEFTGERCAVVGLNPIGAAGRGRAGREPVPAWSLAAQRALAAKVLHFRRQGIHRIAIIAGSLGAVPALRFVAAEPVAAVVLVSPVYDGTPRSLEGWQNLFDDSDMAMATASIARAMRTPVLIVQGLCDELVPVADTSQFISHVPKETDCEYLTLPDEGHIFSNPDSWQQALSTCRRFLRARLEHRTQ